MRNLDLALLALALPVFILAEFPLVGYAAGAGGWVLQRLVRAAVERRVSASEDYKARVGLMAGSMIARGWLVALTVFGVGLAEREAGLAAAVLILALFTVHFTTATILRPFDTDRTQA